MSSHFVDWSVHAAFWLKVERMNLFLEVNLAVLREHSQDLVMRHDCAMLMLLSLLHSYQKVKQRETYEVTLKSGAFQVPSLIYNRS